MTSGGLCKCLLLCATASSAACQIARRERVAKIPTIRRRRGKICILAKNATFQAPRKITERMSPTWQGLSEARSNFLPHTGRGGGGICACARARARER